MESTWVHRSCTWPGVGVQAGKQARTHTHECMHASHAVWQTVGALKGGSSIMHKGRQQHYAHVPCRVGLMVVVGGGVCCAGGQGVKHKRNMNGWTGERARLWEGTREGHIQVYHHMPRRVVSHRWVMGIQVGSKRFQVGSNIPGGIVRFQGIPDGG